jgi:hypothetical protein
MNKDSQQSDAIGNLYRAALYLASDNYDSKQGVEFTEKAVNFFEKNNKFKDSVKALNKALDKYSVDKKKQSLILAEKILDQYLLLK